MSKLFRCKKCGFEAVIDVLETGETRNKSFCCVDCSSESGFRAIAVVESSYSYSSGI